MKRLMIADPLLILGVVWILAASLPALLPSLYTDPLWTWLPNEMLDQATLWMCRAWAACSAAYWLIRSGGPARLHQGSRFDLLREDQVRWFIGVAGLLGSIGTTILSGGQGYTFVDTGRATAASSAGMVFDELEKLAVIYVFLYFQARGRGRLTRSEPLLMLAVLTAQAAIIIAAGSKGAVLVMLAAWLIGNAAGGSRGGLMKELAVGSAALAAIYFTFSLVTHFRDEMLRRQVAANQSYMSALSVQLDAMETAFGEVLTVDKNAASGGEFEAGNILDRMGYVSAVAMLLEQTSGVSPYEHSRSSLMAPILAFVPRSLVDQKVHFFDSGDFARMLGWDFGGFSVTTPGSFYWAWGYEGILYGMATLGTCLGLLANRSNSDGVTGLVSRAVMFREVMMMLDVGQEFQPIVVDMVRTSMFLFTLVLVNRLYRSAPPVLVRKSTAR